MKVPLSIVLVFLCAPCFVIRAQTVPDSLRDTIRYVQEGNYVVAITHRTKAKEKYIPPGKKVTIWLGTEKIKGRITSVSSDLIYINHLGYYPDEIVKIRAFLPGTTAGGAVIAAGGAATLGLGGYLGAISIITIAEGEAWAVFWGTLGLLASVPVVAAGAVFLPVGIIIICYGKTFDLKTKWRLSIQEQLN